jgi:peptidoglycan/xylan/chitin deacetylase (PgdA/CDA1 family)
MRFPQAREVAALGLLVCLLTSGCQPNTARQSSPSSSSAEPTRSASQPTSISADTTLAASATTSPSTSLAATSSVNQTATANATEAVAPLLPPIATLPQPLPARTLTGPRDLGVPVLMYHVIGEAPAGARNPDLYVTPKEFASHMRYLSVHGYHAVTLKQVYDFWHNEGTLPSKPVVISFDDGTSGHFTVAAPLLNELHWPGVLNLVVGKKTLRLKPSIVRALIAAGWEIDSHTMSHEDVPELSAGELKYQIAGSRKKLQKLYGIPVDFFCYPSGRFDDNAVAAVKAAGYLGATTTRGGLARPSQPYLMRRVRVSGGRSAASFGELLAEAR